MPPKYRPGQTDTNGRDYLHTDQEPADVFYYDATDWELNPTSPDFYGVGRDGCYYLAGAQTGTPNDGCNFEDASCWGTVVGDGHDINMYYHIGVTETDNSISISGDTITFSNADKGYHTEQLDTNWVSSARRWWFPGGQDLDVRLDYNNISGNKYAAATSFDRSYWGVRLVLYYNPDNWASVWVTDDMAYSTTRRVYADFNRLGSRISSSFTNYAANSGTLRITKESGTGDTATYKAYFWNGSSWTQLTWSSTDLGDGLNYQTPFIIIVCPYTYQGGWGTIDASNLTISAGNPSIQAGWSYNIEANGQYQKGGAFPEKTMIYTSNNSSQTTDSTYDSYMTIVDMSDETVWLQYSDDAGFTFEGGNVLYQPPRNQTNLNIFASGGVIKCASFHQFLVSNSATSACFNLSFNKDIIFSQHYLGAFPLYIGNTFGMIDSVAGGSFYSHCYNLGYATDPSDNLLPESTIARYTLKPWLTLPTDGDADGAGYRAGGLGSIFSLDHGGYSYIATGNASNTTDDFVWLYRIDKTATILYPEIGDANLSAESILFNLEYSSSAILSRWTSVVIDPSTLDLYIIASYSDGSTTQYRYINKVTYASYNSLWNSKTSIEMNRVDCNITSYLTTAPNYYHSTHWGQENSIGFYGGYLYYCDEDGIYRTTDGSSQTLIYGDSGSGASYEILQPYDRISSFRIVEAEGSAAMVICTTTTTGPVYLYQLVDMSKNTLSSYQDITTDITTEPMFVALGEQ